MIKSERSNNKFVSLLNNNIEEISHFLFVKIDNCDNVNNNLAKIKMNCPYCNHNKKKLTINLDWGNFKCFRCGESGSLIKLVKKLGIYNEFTSLISSLSNISNFNIQSLFKSNTASLDDNIETDELYKKIKKFNKDKFLLPINKISYAKKYALERVFNNYEEVESYLVDDRYIYIPIVINDKLISYMGRRYVEIDNIPRYILHIFDDTIPLIGFVDEVSNNITTNDLYITEGYFDAYAINYVMTNYVAICTFGKNKKNDIINIAKYFPHNTNVFLTLDSVKKDPKIIEDIISFGDTLLKYFNNVYVINLIDDDPADILKNHGSLYLKNFLKNNTISFIKYKILNKGRNIYA